ncbi:hypothetical protein [uncultured Nitratireductor sp.]|uniref:COG3904 family protein n=1 Tax=uncultured Nitratireductor sp. TaxID=520953 RepID=UPI0025E0F4EA|nr:hypothetical protein [uncultured Nitratireductor sp.]
MSDHPATLDEKPKRNPLVRYFSRFDDGALMRWAFVGVLIGSATVLGMDLRELVDRNGGLWPTESTSPMERSVTVLPPAVETGDAREQSADPRQFVRSRREALRDPIRFTLKAGGVLAADGAIDQGAAGRFQAELDARGEYVTSVALNSPGGSLEDAMAISRLVRERGLATSVADGAICASSCPLILAGGVERQAGDKAAIGVHQFYAAEQMNNPAQAMADAQIITARISRHLDEMGIDPALWLHALDTPPRALYYLTPKQMKDYRLTTGPLKLARY